MALAPEATGSVDAFAILAGPTLTLVDIDTVALVGSDPETRVANTFEGAFHVHTFPIFTHPARGTLVHVHAECVVSRSRES